MLTSLQKNKLIKEVESWIGTPWIHNQASKGVGADCVQFLVNSFKNIGVLPEEYKTRKYDKDWAMHNARSILREELVKIAEQVQDIKEGDIVLFITGKTSGHIGIYCGNNKIIHSHIRHGVCEIKLDALQNIIDSIWRIK